MSRPLGSPRGLAVGDAHVAVDELAEDVGIGHEALAHKAQALGLLGLVVRRGDDQAEDARGGQRGRRRR